MIKKILIGSGILLLVLIVIGVIVSRKQTSKPNFAVVELAPKTGYKTWSNEYMGFYYRQDYLLNKIPTTDGRVYANFEILSPDKSASRRTDRILLMEREMSQTLDELDDVQMRRGDSLQYSEEVARVGEMRGLLFRTNDRKERTAYFNKGGRLLVVTLTSQSPFETAESEFNDFLNGIKW